MIPLKILQGKRVGVIGLGASGRAAIAALQAGNAAEIWVWDDSRQQRADIAKEAKVIVAETLEEWSWHRLEALVVSPGVPLHFPQPHPAVRMAKRHNIPITSDIELVMDSQPYATFVGITGTNGKSTTTSLVYHILRQTGRNVQVGGNLGPPALTLEALSKDGVYVLELSSYQLDLLQRNKMQVAVWLNITPDHIDRHGDLTGYIDAKMKIFDRQGRGDHAVISIDDAASAAVCRDIIARNKVKVTPVSSHQPISSGVFVDGVMLVDRVPGKELRHKLPDVTSLRGQHNHQNLAAAYAACRALDIEPATILEAMQHFAGLAHRMQWLGEIEGVQFINDSKATNADAAEKSLRTYQPVYWIVGGVAKENGIDPLLPLMHRVQKAYLIGESAPVFADTLEGQIACETSVTLDKAVEAAFVDARRDALPNAAIVLAPACASFDQYANFEKRGEAFIALFQRLKEREGT